MPRRNKSKSAKGAKPRLTVIAPRGRGAMYAARDVEQKAAARNSAIANGARHALGLANWVNLLWYNMAAAIERATAARDPHADLLEQEAREDRDARRYMSRRLAQNGAAWDWSNWDGSTLPARRLAGRGAIHTISNWVQFGDEPGRFDYGANWSLCLQERGVRELRYYHAAGDKLDTNEDRYTGVLMPDLEPRILLKQAAAWLAQFGEDPAQWTGIMGANGAPPHGAKPGGPR